jgi:hypothetical protein
VTSPIRIPAQALGDSPPAEKTTLPARETSEAKTSATALDEIRNGADLDSETGVAPAVGPQDANIDSPAAAVEQSRKLEMALDSPAVHNVHAEAHEYYGGKEIVNRSRTYSIVSFVIHISLFGCADEDFPGRRRRSL